MKEGRTLKQLAVEIQRQSKAKTDYLADVSNVEVVPLITDLSSLSTAKQICTSAWAKTPTAR